MTDTFYAGGAGDRLVDPHLLTPAVQSFLDAENEVLAGAAAGRGGLVEVGSMAGLHLEWALGRGLRYLGLDVVERYVEDGRRRLEQLGAAGGGHAFEVADAADLASAASDRADTLVLFPFNSIGNMADVDAVLDALREVGLPFVISTYRTDPGATARRREYYEACGYDGLACHDDGSGVRFTAPEGLNTTAYHPEVFLSMCRAHGVPARAVPFGDFGMAYTTA